MQVILLPFLEILLYCYLDPSWGYQCYKNRTLHPHKHGRNSQAEGDLEPPKRYI